MILPEGPYDIICADPPWRFRSNSKARPGRNAWRHYPVMNNDEIAAMPITDMVGKDALLFMWATVPHLPECIDVLTSWGFQYKSSMVWVKQRIGTGYWVRNRHEYVLVGRRGKFACPSPAPFNDSILDGAQREHSRKPESLQKRIEEVWPETKKIELFARAERQGWDTWGNEVGHFGGKDE